MFLFKILLVFLSIASIKIEIGECFRGCDQAAAVYSQKELACEEFCGMPKLKADSRTYYFDINGTNYHTAARICRLRGLQLASIPSRADDDAILNMIIKKGWGNKQFWIGASNQGENNTKEYYWNHNGRYLKQGYENWASNQPDNNGDDCFAVQINYNKQWDDHKCATELGFVCESLISSV